MTDAIIVALIMGVSSVINALITRSGQKKLLVKADAIQANTKELQAETKEVHDLVNSQAEAADAKIEELVTARKEADALTIATLTAKLAARLQGGDES